MYMAFVIHEENEDLVSFYVRENNGAIFLEQPQGRIKIIDDIFLI